MERIVKMIVPDMPADRRVRGTRDSLSWYKVVYSTKTLLAPTLDILKSNIRELERFAEAVTNFATMEFNDSIYKWNKEDLELCEAHTPEELITLFKRLPDWARENDGMLACDIESRGVDWEDNRLLSIGFAYGPSHCAAAYNIPIQGSRYEGPALDPEVYQQVYEAFQELMSQPDITYVWHNGKFDCGRLKYMCNIDARVDEDTILQHFVCINEKQGTHGLKDLGQLYLQAPAWDDELDTIKRNWCREHKVTLKQFHYDDIPTSVLIPYMQLDCISTYRLNLRFKELARPGTSFIYSQLCRASNVYGQVELAGQMIDLEYMEELEAKLDGLVAEYQEKLDSLTAKYWDPLQYSIETGAKSKPGDKFNPKSPKQLKWLLSVVLGHPVPATDAETLKILMEETKKGEYTDDAREFMEAVLGARKYGKYLETYVLGIRDELCRDGRVRCTFNLHGTETGRLSCSHPNMQNIPKDAMVKNLIIPGKGKSFIQLDYSQAELRVLAMLSEDPALVAVYQEGRDLHDAVADMMFGEGGHKNKLYRSLAKSINFGVAYGRGPGSISRMFGKTMAESRAIIDRWFKPMPKVKEYIDGRRRAATRGEPCTTIFGRERHFVLTDAEMNHIQNEYINTPIQGTASDFTMLSLMNIYDYLKENWSGVAEIVSTVHDSIMIEADDEPEVLRTIGARCQQIMAETPKMYVPDCPVPFVADVEIGYRWGEMYELDLETGLPIKED